MPSNLTRFGPGSALARLNPLRDIASVFDIFDSMRNARMLDAEVIRLDVTETDQAYVVKAEMPGIKKEDIKVSVQGDQVTISAESSSDEEHTEGNVVYKERYQGKQFRSFTLPQSVDADNADATCQDGVLQLTLPKRPDAGGKQLSIH